MSTSNTLYRTRKKVKYSFHWGMPDSEPVDGTWRPALVHLSISMQVQERHSRGDTSWDLKYFKPLWSKVYSTDAELAESARIVEDWLAGRVDNYLMEAFL